MHPAFGEHRGREIEQFDELLVEGRETQIGIAQRDAAGEIIDDGFHHVTLAGQQFFAVLALGDVGIGGDET
jgi:hypothetical protein